MPRYRFDEFLLSPRRRLLVRGGRELPLIPRYFDLLLFLVERRHDAVHRRDIFDGVWRDVVVSDSALSQAIRTLRRTLGDDSREPRFIRTVARHGYQFVHPQVVEEVDDGQWPAALPGARPEPPDGGASVPAEGAPDPLGDSASDRPGDDEGYEPLLRTLVAPLRTEDDEAAARDAAEQLHARGTGETLRRLGTRAGHARGRALLRDARWTSAVASDVPLVGAPGAMAAAVWLVRIRVRRLLRVAAERAIGSALGAASAGAGAGVAGGVLLWLAPGSTAAPSVAAVLAAIGALVGAGAGCAVGGALALAEVAARSWRAPALTLAGVLGGGLVGFAVQGLASSTLSGVLGLWVDVGGGLEGLALGAGAGAGYAWATRRSEGPAAPHGRARALVAVTTGVACGLAGLALTATGRPLVGGTIHLIASFAGSSAVLTPLGRLLGEPGFGPVTQALLGAGEGACFGAGLAFGLTRRPRAWRAAAAGVRS